MRIKKFTGRTEQEAIAKVKEELGLNALILNIRKTKPRGIFSLFRKPVTEVTAAYADKDGKKPEESNERLAAATSEAERLAYEETDDFKRQRDKIRSLEEKISSQEELLNKLMGQLSLNEQLYRSYSLRKYDNRVIQVFYDTLVAQGVTPDIAEKVLEDANAIDDESRIDIKLVSTIVYNTIINILGPAEPIELVKTKRTRFVVLMGPTGVGKTTTIAKISSILMLYHNLKVGLITADTYRIAAIEQLKTYAEILGLDVDVIYNSQDLENHLEPIIDQENDVVLVDTAGRSHRNQENFKELSEFLALIPDSTKYLVLSLTTKYEDLLSIANAYSVLTDYKLVFTKLDETSCYGAILNLCYLTGKRMAYITNGQNVPDDIEVAHPEKITKALLGIGGAHY
ncbi:MAG: flagellar biosynthesis protein FlhF [Clostridiales bacterium]|jgi:flagellar biosynthesis protein FlhF|nr:flagellar biosynthesis protein FlhF [Clostridiales bacterium]